MATTEQHRRTSTPTSSTQFVFRAVDEVGATLNAALVVMGDKLGLYRALADAGSLTPVELARRSGVSERYVREWLNAQAAGGYVDYDPAGGSYTLPPEQAMALTDEQSPAYLPGFFQIALGTVIDSPRITEAARSGEGVGWHEHNHDVFEGCERFFRPGYNAALVPDVAAGARRRRREARGRRQGRRHRLRARLVDDPDGAGVPELDVRRLRLPRGLDRDRPPARARRRASPIGCAFETAAAGTDHGDGYELVTMFDCLHDMGDPVGAARQVHRMLSPDGTWLIVEPMAGDRVEDNLNPVGRAFYGFSTFLCTPASLSQEVGLALGAQAGEARIGDVVSAGGFTRFRRASRDAVQPRVRSATVRTTIDRVGRPAPPRARRRSRARAEQTRAPLPRRGGLRRARRRAGLLGALRGRRADRPAAPHLDARALAGLEGADRLPRAPLPRRDVRSARERADPTGPRDPARSTPSRSSPPTRWR